MSHIRTQLRNQVKTLLTGLATTGANVFTNRIDPLETGSLPALTITISSDQNAGSETIGSPRRQIHEVALVVTAHAKGDLVDDVLDTICTEVETVLANNKTLGGLAKDLQIQTTETEFERGDKVHGTAEMTFQIDYLMHENAPEVAI